MHRAPARLYGFGVPLAGLIAVIFGQAPAAFSMVIAYLLISTLTLGAPDAFRCAAGKLMSTKKVMGSLIFAIALVVIVFFGGMLALAEIPSLPIDVESAFFYMLAGCAFTAVRCLEELFASQGDPTSARMTCLITVITLSAALLIPGETAIYCGLAGLGWLLVGSCLAMDFTKKEMPQLNGAIFREIPFALLRTLLYPAIFFGTVWLLKLDSADPALICGFFAGLILIELAKSPVRRAKDESAGLKIGVSVGVLVIGLAIFALSCFWYGAQLPLGVAAVLLAGACALVMYAPLDWESLLAAMALLASAGLISIGITPDVCSFPQEILIGPAIGILLCLLMAKQWALLLRKARANRIRRRAMKRSRS